LNNTIKKWRLESEMAAPWIIGTLAITALPILLARLTETTYPG